MSLNDTPKRGEAEEYRNMTDHERYESGYQYGYEDQQLKNHGNMYMFQEDTTFKDHTDYFILGWVHGFIGVPKAYEVVIKLRYERTGEENAALASKSMSDTWDKVFGK